METKIKFNVLLFLLLLLCWNFINKLYKNNFLINNQVIHFNFLFQITFLVDD